METFTILLLTEIVILYIFAFVFSKRYARLSYEIDLLKLIIEKIVMASDKEELGVTLHSVKNLLEKRKTISKGFVRNAYIRIIDFISTLGDY